MVNGDTIKLLKECNAGLKMGVSSIYEVLDKVDDDTLKTILTKAKDKHITLENETYRLLG